MAIVLTVRYNQNTRQRDLLGDLTTTIYEVAIAIDPNTYPLGGEPIDFSLQYNEVHSVSAELAIDPAGAGAATTGAFGVVFERAAGAGGVNTGFLRIFQSAGAAAPLVELAAAVYAQAMQFVLVVHGRPATDAS